MIEVAVEVALAVEIVDAGSPELAGSGVVAAPALAALKGIDAVSVLSAAIPGATGLVVVAMEQGDQERDELHLPSRISVAALGRDAVSWRVLSRS
jgi:hypothetical protein